MIIKSYYAFYLLKTLSPLKQKTSSEIESVSYPTIFYYLKKVKVSDELT